MTGRPVRVAVDALADRPERTFTYLLPDALGPAAPGALVLVPYGRRLALGYLLPDAGAPDAESAELREVEAIVSEPMLTPDLLALAEEVAAYYRAPVGTTLASMLPPGLESRVRRTWQVTDAAVLPPELHGLADATGLIEDAPLLRHAPRRGRAAWLERLRRSGAVRAAWTLRPPEVNERRVRTLRSAAGVAPAPRRAPLQAALLAAIADGERTFPELAEALAVDAGRLLAPARRLVERGAAELGWRAEERDPLAHRARHVAPDHDLAAEQRAAVEAIAGMSAGGELLLEGVAAAGKTEVYLAALDAVLRDGGAAILLVPELSGVAQLVDRVAALVGDEVATLHSGLSAGERHDAWWRILRGEARVVVGTRLGRLRAAHGPAPDHHRRGARRRIQVRPDAAPRCALGGAAARVLTGARVVGAPRRRTSSPCRVLGAAWSSASILASAASDRAGVELIDLREELAGGNRSIFSRTPG